MIEGRKIERGKKKAQKGKKYRIAFPRLYFAIIFDILTEFVQSFSVVLGSKVFFPPMKDCFRILKSSLYLATVDNKSDHWHIVFQLKVFQSSEKGQIFLGCQFFKLNLPFVFLGEVYTLYM